MIKISAPSKGHKQSVWEFGRKRTWGIRLINTG